MSKPVFKVQIERYEKIKEIDGAWMPNDFRRLLTDMEFPLEDSNPDEELRELCVMCLQDKESEDAAEIVLKYRLGDKLAAGQIRNLAIDMTDEKLWEQYADQSLHEQFFHVGSLMFEAFPSEYYEPDAVRVSVKITPENPLATEELEHALHESMLVRLLADGMDESSILRRLFDDQLTGNSFPEADSIIWIVGTATQAGDSTLLEIISSAHWIDSLKEVDSYQSSATPDKLSI